MIKSLESKFEKNTQSLEIILQKHRQLERKLISQDLIQEENIVLKIKGKNILDDDMD